MNLLLLHIFAENLSVANLANLTQHIKYHEVLMYVQLIIKTGSLDFQINMMHEKYLAQVK